jgi:Tfp pilus assembly protein PilX
MCSSPPMKTHAHHKQKGSALVTVLILTMAVALMAGALSAYSISERKLNRHVILRIQAEDAAEALLEYCSSEIAVKFMSQSSIPTTYLSTNPVKYYLTRAPVLYGGGTNNFVSTTNLKVWASQGAQGTITIDPNNPENANDPLKGQTVRAQIVQLLAQATATDNNGTSLTNYATQAIEVRDASLFSFAIFYNIPMEFHPSPQMDIYGPVFSNQNVYLTEGNGMAFHSTFATAGKFSAQPLDDVAGAGSARPQGQDIYFTDGLKVDAAASHPNGDNTQDFYDVNNPVIGGHNLGTWADSFLDTAGAPNQGTSPLDAAHSYSFSQAASTLYKGYVADQSMDVQTQNPPGIVDPTTALKLIQPPDPTAATSDPVEAEKFSTQSHLFIVVTPNNNGTGTGASVMAFYNPVDATSYLYSNPSTKVKNTAAQRTAWLSGANLGKVLFSSTGTVTNSVNGSNSLAGIVNTQRLMNDPRENKPINTVDIDLGVLNTAITPATPALTITSNSGAAWDIDGTTQKPWNGGLYVDVETDVGGASGWATTSDIGGITATGTETAVRLVDGGTLPSRGTNVGLSVATNAPVYVVGNFNSNGTLEGGSTPLPSDVMTPDSNEVPAMVAGDSINILSKNWWSASKPSGDANITNSDGTYKGEPTAGDTEIAAAFLTGNVPTNTSTYSYSGGVENYMRFNENWGSATLRYRGSIVALFNSNVATGPWANAKYGAPTRQWGYDNKFATGGYPPNTPYLRTLRRINYNDLKGPAAFNAMKADTNYTWVQMQ